MLERFHSATSTGRCQFRFDWGSVLYCKLMNTERASQYCYQCRQAVFGNTPASRQVPGENQMDKRAQLNLELLEASKAQNATNITAHKQQTARIKGAVGRRLTLQKASPQTPLPKIPLDFLAIGDSWFEYPLNGNGPSFGNTAIVAQSQLGSMGTPPSPNPESSTPRAGNDCYAVLREPGNIDFFTAGSATMAESTNAFTRCHSCICRG